MKLSKWDLVKAGFWLGVGFYLLHFLMYVMKLAIFFAILLLSSGAVGI